MNLSPRPTRSQDSAPSGGELVQEALTKFLTEAVSKISTQTRTKVRLILRRVFRESNFSEQQFDYAILKAKLSNPLLVFFFIWASSSKSTAPGRTVFLLGFSIACKVGFVLKNKIDQLEPKKKHKPNDPSQYLPVPINIRDE